MIGELKNFRVGPFIEAADILAQGDEFLRALQVLDNLPAFYRDHEPSEVVALREKILAGLMTTRDYMLNVNDFDLIDVPRAVQILKGTTRGQIIDHLVGTLNADGVEPDIVDMGPGDFWMAVGMKASNRRFKYWPYSIHPQAEAKAQAMLTGCMGTTKVPNRQAPLIFVACEIIEHLHFEREIRMVHDKMCQGGLADFLIMSTPLYTFGPGNDKWQQPDQAGLLGHLRAYTPKELAHSVRSLFPEMELFTLTDVLINVIGRNPHHGLDFSLPPGYQQHARSIS